MSFRTRSDERREQNDRERVVGTCGNCGGPVVDGREFIQPHCRHCGATPKRPLPVIEMAPAATGKGEGA